MKKFTLPGPFSRRRQRSVRTASRSGLKLETLECRRLLAGDGVDLEPFGGSISGIKWEDANRNGERDEGERGLAEVRIFIDDNNNGRLDEGERHTLTRQDDPDTDVNETGTYRLAGLDEGRYVVRELVPRGFVQTFPAGHREPGRGGHLVELAGGDNATRVNFGNFRLEVAAFGSVRGTKWQDTNGNGEREGDEPGLAGVVIFADQNNNGRLDRNEPSTRTARDNPETAADEAGRYELRLRPGNHVIREVVPDGFVQTFPRHVVVEPVEPVEPQPTLDGDERDEFASPNPRRLDLVLEEGEVFVETVSMTVHPFCIVPVHVDVVASDPDILFENMSDAQLNGCGGDVSNFEISITGDGGSHRFELLFVDPENGNQHTSIPVTINVPDARGGHRVIVRPGAAIEGRDFGNRPVANGRIQGRKWLDANGNGQRDADEPGLPGVVVYLDLNENGRLDERDRRTVTRRDNPETPEDEAGRYQFSGLREGDYVVREVVPDGHIQTFPGATAEVISSLTGRFNPGNALDMEISDVSAAIDDAGQLNATVEVTVTWPDSCGMLKEGETDHSTVGNQLLIEVHGHQVGEVCADVETPRTESVLFEGIERGRHDVVATLHEDVGDQPDVATLNAVGVIVVGAPGHHLVKLGENEVVEGVDFGNQSTDEAASVHGLKWLDRNGNGQRDRGEPGVAGITIYSDLNLNGQFDDDEPHAVTMTDNERTEINETGHYWLELKPGQHLIAEVLPEGFERTFPPPSDRLAPWPASEPYYFNLVAGQTLTGIDFGNRPIKVEGGAIHGRKWVDINGNGERDADEPGLPGVTIYLDANLNNEFDEDEPRVRTMRDLPQTDFDEAGLYWFKDVEPGFYIVREVVPDGFEQTFPTEFLCDAIFCQGRGHMVNVEPGQSIEGLDFGNRPIKVEGGSLHGRKWVDSNGNGERDADEPGLPGVTIYLDANLNNEFDEDEPRVRTMRDDPDTDFDEAGLYWFRDVEPGFYIVREVVPDGFEQTFPPVFLCEAVFCQGRGHIVNVEPGQSIEGLNFGNRPRGDAGSVHGVKWLDRNGNGERDEGELGIPGVTVFADLNLNGRRDRGEPSAETMRDDPNTERNERGVYWLKVRPGEHLIMEVVPEGFVQTFPDPHRRIAFPFNLGHVVNVEPGAEVVGINFGNRPSEPPRRGAVAGFKWVDRNGNGEVDRNERRLPGVVIFSDMNGNHELDPNEPRTRTEGERGAYSLALEPGPHVIREVVPEGFRQTFPMGSAEIFEKNSVNLPPGQALSFELVDAAVEETRLALTFQVVWPNGCGSLIGDRAEVRTEGDHIFVSMAGTQIGDVCTQALQPERQTIHLDAPPAGVYQVRGVLHESASPDAEFERSFTFGSALAIDANGGYHVVVHPGETVWSLRFGNMPTMDFHEADFNMDGDVNVPDIDLLTDVIRAGDDVADFDLSGDGKVDESDLDEMVRKVMGTRYGDVNLDGVFNSSDLVKVFQAGKYEDDIEDNASWAEGDFDGDGDFTTSDLVLVFRQGQFDAAAKDIDAAFRS